MAIAAGSRVKFSAAYLAQWLADQQGKPDEEKVRPPFTSLSRADDRGTVAEDAGVNPPAWVVRWDDGHASVTRANLLDEVI